ncbi:kinase-like protein [Heliocybe sulcata]|uniref:Kinase-like protein n=1 Tax=Heliocybe sulcata TaxID=5364 RepID=A0A5C3MY39_9AGAM|nr:kinase-like protein [Heliocybe sulcata]
MLTGLYPVARGLAYLHWLGIAHGNLKPSNILIDDSGHARIGGFGRCHCAHGLWPEWSRSARYTAPEILFTDYETVLSGVDIAALADVYSFARVCLEVYSGERPFTGTTLNDHILSEVYLGRSPPRPQGGLKIPNDVWSFMETCWARDPALRPNIRTVVKRFEEIRNQSQ